MNVRGEGLFIDRRWGGEIRKLAIVRYPRFTAGADKRVQEVTASNGSTVYRTTVTGLSRDQATGLCNAIKAAGGDCFVR